jgi:hypothetical protein
LTLLNRWALLIINATKTEKSYTIAKHSEWSLKSIPVFIQIVYWVINLAHSSLSISRSVSYSYAFSFLFNSHSMSVKIKALKKDVNLLVVICVPFVIKVIESHPENQNKVDQTLGAAAHSIGHSCSREGVFRWTEDKEIDIKF